MGEPAAAHAEDVHGPVVVEVSLHAVGHALLVRHAGGLAPVLERAVAAVAKHRHPDRGLERRERGVEEAVAVEVLEDRATRLGKTVDTDARRHVLEPREPGLGGEERIEGKTEPRIDPVGPLAERHVGEVQQPLHFQVVGGLGGRGLEDLREVAHRGPRPRRIAVHRLACDREDARARADAVDAVVVLAAAESGHALEVGDRREPPARELALLAARSAVSVSWAFRTSPS